MTNITVPPWSEAPPWAEFLALDNDGQWFWYSKKPQWVGEFWSPEGGQNKHAGEQYDQPPDYDDTETAAQSLKSRPGRLKRLVQAYMDK